MGLEILALRHQVSILKRKNVRPRLCRWERGLRVFLRRVWSRWTAVLVIVKPETVVRWHRAGFRLYWSFLSRRREKGRPRISLELRQFIARMAKENPTWGSPRIHGELLKLGLEISERTVSRYLAGVGRRGDARKLSVRAASADYVITSPPYLNAIDYLRGHRLSLVWMGYSVETIRGIRSESVGSEAGHARTASDPVVSKALRACLETELASRERGMLVRFLEDMRKVLQEVQRVLKPNGRAVFVVGNCTVRGAFVANSAGIKSLAGSAGLRARNEVTRELPPNRRYLPPPEHKNAGDGLAQRLREEVVLTLTHA
jgi:SAM-dependent methyltransferase